MNIYELSKTLELLERTTSRNEITAILAGLFKKAKPEEIDKLCYLVLGRLAPKFEGVEFQLATKSMIKAVARAYNIDETAVTKEYKQQGDVGSVAEAIAIKSLAKSQSSSGPKPSNTNQSVSDVHNKLMEVAIEEGTGSVERKIAGVAELLSSLDPLSAKYVVRIPLGKLRLGFSDMTILDSLSWMKTGGKSLRSELESAYNVSADIGMIAKTFKKKGIKCLSYAKATAGIPIRSQQSERLPTAEEIIKKLGECAVENKLDGFRAQVHVMKTLKHENIKARKQKKQLALGEKVKKREVLIVSRNLENITHMFPEIAEAVRKLNVQSAVLDGEAIGYDPKTGKHLPFQETIQRKRKHGIEEIAKKIPLRYYAFDILELNGKDLLKLSFKERRKMLETLLQKTTDKSTVQLTKQSIVSKPDELIKLFKTAIKKGHEGIMVKKLDEPYKAGSRNFNWVKFKHMGKGKLADTLDCLVMGYYRGEGKRSGFGIGAFLVGVARANNEYVTVAKIGTGLSDEEWVNLREKCGRIAGKNKPDEYNVPKNLIPDAWVTPKIVVEIAADEITKTPLHSAGLALRFPRLISFRDDKSPSDATTIRELEKLFRMQ